MFKGSIVALVTPMNSDGTIDYSSLEKLIEWHIESHTTALVIAGTTGEGSTLTTEEQSELLTHAVKQVANRIPVIAGTGSNSTEHALHLTFNAKKIGVDAVLMVTPYYNRPTQKGLYEHYKVIANEVSIPIILYNVPSRTACDLLPETVARLTEFSNIIGIKEATGKVERAIDIKNRCGKQFLVFSGDDATAYDLLVNGADGVISVTANVIPQRMSSFCELIMNGKTSLAETINNELMPLHQKLFLEPNPIPVKWALHKMNLIPPGIRLPLTVFDPVFHTELEQTLMTAGLLQEKTYL